MRYFGAEYIQNGFVCRRRVVGEYDVKATDPPSTPKGIVTSFGQFVRNAD